MMDPVYPVDGHLHHPHLLEILKDVYLDRHDHPVDDKLKAAIVWAFFRLEFVDEDFEDLNEVLKAHTALRTSIIDTRKRLTDFMIEVEKLRDKE